MAKIRKQAREGNELPGGRTTGETKAGSLMEGTLTAYAETLGKAMGNLRNHVDSWKGQRTHLVEQLSNLVSEAQTLLTDLGHTATEQVGRIRRRGRPRKNAPTYAIPVVAQKPGRRAKRKMMSAAGRAAISAAQKKRWAKLKAQK